jgi:S1-C subfamily serine protease
MNNTLKVLLAIAVFAVSYKAGNLIIGPSHPTSDKAIAKTTAMITNMRQNSGGTGVVYSSSSTESKILTNAHVCRVVKNGGLVTTENKKVMVASYQVSQFHDLCMITVRENLGIDTEVASNAPDMYEDAIISGHPSLLPTIVTKGHFSQKEIIAVMTGMRKCSDADYASPLSGEICAFLGFIPLITTYRAQVASPTIMPGSSGSAVFNGSGQIAGLVFAGQGELGYAHIVPQEYVSYFVKQELADLPIKRPNDSIDMASDEENARKKLKTTCADKKGTTEYMLVEEYCEYVLIDMVFEK